VSEPGAPDPGAAPEARACTFCGKPAAEGRALHQGRGAGICDECVLAAAGRLVTEGEQKQFKYAYEALRWHFTGWSSEQIVTSSRQFPGHMRADVQHAVEQLISIRPIRFLGIHERQHFEMSTVAALMMDGQLAATLAPLQYDEVDIGEADAARCLNNALWLCAEADLRYAVLLSQARSPFGRESGMRIEIALPAGERGSAFVQQRFRELEAAVNAARAYRGKILSLEQDNRYTGRSSGILVHRLPAVQRDEVILPDATLDLLDRNVLKFVGTRPALRALGLSTKKGILLYGPPGTGKTHTIRYLASNLPGHTTLIITAEQVGLLAQYMSLARLLQPSMVVIEDADLIALDRGSMGGPCEEVLLNKLLNEMDGLREQADILFVLTTNRPEQLEAALANRPGRIDQAIEVPLPDDSGREKLVRLYGAGLELPPPVVAAAVERTAGGSAAVIKELMRRVAQAAIEAGGSRIAATEQVRLALDDMLFTGGRLNAALLGGGGAGVS
jgi:ATPase family associated with various cellular activities (AAA)/ClpX C4-type zinc finger